MAAIKFDEEGDLMLRIPGNGAGGTPQKYMFNSRKLQDVYKPGDTVHEVLLNPDYEFTEHYSPRAVQLAYCMIRDPYDASIPDQLNEELLFNLLKFTRCLNITRITRPWAKKWAVAIKLSVASPATVTSVRLFIAWELGDRASFDRMVTWIALNTEKPENGKVQEALINTSYFDDIVDIKNSQGASIVNVLIGKLCFLHLASSQDNKLKQNTIARGYRAGTSRGYQLDLQNDQQRHESLVHEGGSRPDGNRPCRHDKGKDRCEESLAGSLSVQLYACKLWAPRLPRPAVDDQTKSIATMRDEIKYVKDNHHELCDWNDKSTHPECGMKLPLFVELEPQIQRSSVLSNHHFNEHFNKQGKLTGFVVVDYIEIASD
ncbi:hypothetical protein PG993_011058 [Apiospora rasikravindrae]|uniref:Uncharacterized protein n=1 Tax=Apiospora rasikravindrae TaxID=990691 RepID=A0ABR1SD61_9PEZI